MPASIDFQPELDFQPDVAQQIPGMEKLGGSLPQMPAPRPPAALDFQPVQQTVQSQPVKTLPVTFTGAPSVTGVRLPSAQEAEAISNENTAQMMRAVNGQNGVGAMPAAPSMERMPTPMDDITAPYRVLKGTAKNVADFVHDAVARDVAIVAEPKDSEHRKQMVEQSRRRFNSPLVPLEEISPGAGLEHGIWQGIQGLTSPENLAIMAGAGVAGKTAAAAQSPYIRAGWQAFNTAMSGYFAAHAGKGTVEGVNQAADDFGRGDYDSMAQHLGFSTVNALIGAVAGKHAIDSSIDIGQQSVEGYREGKAYAAARDEVQAGLNAKERAQRGADAQAAKDAEAAARPKLAAGPIDFQPEDNGANGPAGKSGEALRPQQGGPSTPATPAAAAAPAAAAEPAKTDAEGNLPAQPAAPKIGDARDIGHGPEQLARVPLKSIVNPPPPAWRPQGNVLYPERVAEYVSGDRPSSPVELRQEDDGTYSIHEGYHRVEAARQRGEKDILAWTPAETKSTASAPVEKQEAATSRNSTSVEAAKQEAFATPALPARVLAGPATQTEPSGQKPAPEVAQEGETQVPPVPQGKTSLAGDEATVKTARGTKLETRYAVVPASRLVTSHDNALNENPQYPAELQPRDRTRAASEAQITDIAGKLDPAELGSSYQASTGAPIVGRDRVVESGNGRTIALRRLYETNHPNAQRYRQWLTTEAPKLGIRGDVSKVPDPVLVRLRAPQPNEDRPQLAREMNENAVAAMSESEQARADANHLDPKLMTLFAPSEDGDVMHAGNRHFVRGFIDRAIAPAERGQFQTAEGTLSQSGVRRVRNAIFARAYGAGDALARVAESPDNEIRNVTNGMVQAAGHVAALENAIAEGKAHPLSIAPEATAAAEKLAALRGSGQTVEDYLKQMPMFGGDLAPEARQALAVFDRHKRSPKKIGAVLREYSRIVQGLGDPRQQTLAPGGSERRTAGSSTEVTARTPSKMAILKAAAERVEEEYGRTSGDRQAVLGGEGERAGGGAAEAPGPPAGGEGEAAQRTAGEPARPANTAAPAAEAFKIDVARRRAAQRGSISNKPEEGPHGPITRLFANKPKQALEWVRSRRTGIAAGAIQHPELGPIGLAYGEPGDPAHDFEHGFGVSHIDAKHPGWLDQNVDAIAGLPVVERFHNDAGRMTAAVLFDGTRRAVVSRDWKKQPTEAWLLTAYDRPAPAASVGVREAPEGAGPTSPTTGREPSTGESTGVPGTHATERLPSGGDSSIEPAEKQGNGTAGTKRPGLLDDTRGGASIDFLTLGARHFVNQDVAPAAKQVAATLVEAKDDVLKVLAPAARGPQAAVIAHSVRANAAEMARKGDRARAALEKAQAYFDRREPEQNYAFMDRIERGRPQPSIPEQAIAGIMRKLLDERRDAVRELGGGALERFYRNYFPHLWQDTERKRQVFADLGKSPIEGSKAFLHHRSIETIREGLDLGLEPISSNPVDLVLAKLREMDKFVMAHQLLGEMGRAGLLRFTVSDKDAPEGYAKVNDPVFTVRTNEGGVGGYYYTPEPAAQVLNNYLAPGLQGHGWYRAIRGAGNLLNQAQLGMSAYHGVFTAFEASVSRLAAGMYAAAKGQPQRAAALAATSPAAPFLTTMRGDKMLKEWYAPGTQGNQLAQLVDAVVEAGGRAHMDTIYQTQVTRAMMKAFRSGNVIGGILRAPFAGVEQAARPIMEWLVPRLKMGAFSDLAQVELERLGDDATDEQKRAALARAWDSIDNRFGQLVYDNLFWNKVAKDMAMISVRSVGWNVGDIRESAGAAADAARFARGKGDFTPRMSYIPALVVMAGLAGAALYYLWHGEAPQTLKDYYFPRDAHGKRWSLPNYVKDYYNWSSDPVKTARNKLHPLLTLTWEMLSNEDYFGDEIRNPNHPVVKQALEAARHVGQAFTPISARDLLKKSHEPLNEKLMPFVGLTHAPKSLDRKPVQHRRHRPAA